MQINRRNEPFKRILLLILLTVVMPILAQASNKICISLFNKGTPTEQDYQRYEIAPEVIDQFFKKVESKYGAGGAGTVYKSWAQQLPTSKNIVYRGMRLSPESLSHILQAGLELGKGRADMVEIYSAWNAEVPLSYGFPGSALTSDARRLAVLVQIDLTELKFTDESQSGPAYVAIKENVPIKAIQRILIFDPQADPLGFPWKDLLKK